MRKVFIKIFIILFVMILIIFSLAFKSFSEYLNDLKEEQSQLQNQIDSSNTEIEIIESQLSESLAEIAQLNDKIITLQIEIEQLESKESELQKQIDKEEIELQSATEQYENQKKLLETRLVAMYESSDTTYLDFLLKSNSLSEFISNYYMLSEIVSSDTELLETVSNKKDTIEKEKLSLDKQKTELEEAREDKEKKSVSLENMSIIQNSYMSKLTNEEKEQEKKLAEYQEAIKRVEAEILLATTANIGSDYVGGTMLWPIPGYTKITSPFGMRTHPITGIYKLHTGMDIGAPLGTDFLAANDGVVTKAEYNSAYGNMVIINHGGGVSTLYAHGSEILVQVGQEVKKGDPVLKVGSTGYSTGAHAHFEVRINGQYMNPQDYVSPDNNSEPVENIPNQENVQKDENNGGG